MPAYWKMAIYWEKTMTPTKFGNSLRDLLRDRHLVPSLYESLTASLAGNLRAHLWRSLAGNLRDYLRREGIRANLSVDLGLRQSLWANLGAS
jgi:hypothetical protein